MLHVHLRRGLQIFLHRHETLSIINPFLDFFPAMRGHVGAREHPGSLAAKERVEEDRRMITMRVPGPAAEQQSKTNTQDHEQQMRENPPPRTWGVTCSMYEEEDFLLRHRPPWEEFPLPYRPSSLLVYLVPAPPLAAALSLTLPLHLLLDRFLDLLLAELVDLRLERHRLDCDQLPQGAQIGLF